MVFDIFAIVGGASGGGKSTPGGNAVLQRKYIGERPRLVKHACGIASGVLAVAFASTAFASTAFAASAFAACEDMVKLPVKAGKITSAVAVLKDSKVVLPLRSLIAPADFCRVAVTLTPTDDSVILAEVWLPDPKKWNGNFLGAGGGGFGGSVSAPAGDMGSELAKGYATAGDDLGHEISSPTDVDTSWAIGHPEKIKDFAYRADHVTAEFAKALIAAYYGRAPQFSYFRGCSNGGHEALMEAQRYPEDYDGIVAGAPANAWTHLMANFLWNERALFDAPQSEIPKAKLAVIQSAVLAKCDALDGVKDGVINDPAMCRFDPAVLACKAGDAPDCLTHPQLEALRKIYEGPVNPGTGEKIYPGFPPGYEGLTNNWDFWILGLRAQSLMANHFFGSFVWGDPKWDYHTFDFAKDVHRTDVELGAIVNSDSPDLGAFAARGGKLIIFQGWADAAVTPWGTIQYFESVRKNMGAEPARRFARLFMAPGMMHCGGGPGPNNFDAVASVAAWREKNQAPETIIAARYAPSTTPGAPSGEPVSTRPLCAYPKVAHWTGHGSPDEAKNYLCRAGAGAPHLDASAPHGATP